MNRKLRLKILEKFDYQVDFAQAVKVDESFVSKVIRERKQLSPEKQKQWANILGCRPYEIFKSSALDVSGK